MNDRDRVKQHNQAPADAKKDPKKDVTKTGPSTHDAKRTAEQNDELEGLEESFPASDAPASTRRSSKD